MHNSYSHPVRTHSHSLPTSATHTPTRHKHTNNYNNVATRFQHHSSCSARASDHQLVLWRATRIFPPLLSLYCLSPLPSPLSTALLSPLLAYPLSSRDAKIVCTRARRPGAPQTGGEGSCDPRACGIVVPLPTTLPAAPHAGRNAPTTRRLERPLEGTREERGEEEESDAAAGKRGGRVQPIPYHHPRHRRRRGRSHR